MKGFLNPPRLEYVLKHLAHHLDDFGLVSDKIIFAKSKQEAEACSGKIIFMLSDEDINLSRVLWLDELPILFPLSEDSIFSFVDPERHNLVFPHDVLKSVFYLLSGYQEYANTQSRDKLNRFSFTDSVQHALKITQKPIVNYYFDTIVEAIHAFTRKTDGKQRRLFETFGFMLSHDVDFVDQYTKSYYLYKVKEVLGLRKSRLSRIKNIQLGISGFLKYAGLLRKDNPYWNFEFMRELERENNFRSAFYFLDQGILHSDAYYSFAEPRIGELFHYLKNESCEIGLHGTVESRTSETKMRSSLEKLSMSSKTTITGVRQHRLLWKHPDTALIQEKLGLKYDTTLGFAAHEGFRNSYCWPFRLYDFQAERMMSLWEIPLVVMDGTLFAYQSYAPEKALEKCHELMQEVKKFGGIFTLLWHNSFFDDITYPGITDFYRNILKHIASQGPENVLGPEILNRLEKHQGA